MSRRLGDRVRRAVALLLALATLSVFFILPADVAESQSYELLVSSTANRANPVPLEGETVTGDIAVFVSPENDISEVDFFLDSSFHKTERKIPYDFNGTSGSVAHLYDTTGIADGQHEIKAEIALSAGGTDIITATFTVANNAPALTFSPGSLSFAISEGGADSATANLDTTDV